MKYVLKNMFTINFSGKILASIIVVCSLIGCSERIPEQVIEEIIAPDESFKLVITQTVRDFGGIQGNIYKVCDVEYEGWSGDSLFEYAEEGLPTLVDYIVWDDEKEEFFIVASGTGASAIGKEGC